MDKFRKIILCFAVLAVSVLAEEKKLPRGLKACSRKDPNFNECATKEANNYLPIMVEGDKQIELPSMNPLIVPKMELTMPGLRIVLTNAEVHGLKDSKVESCKMDFDANTLEVEITIPLLQLVSRYSMDGQIVKIPLTGSGNCNVTIAGLGLTYIMQFHTNTTHGDGMKYIEIDTSDIKHNTPHVQVHLDNLPLGEAGNTLINQNIGELIEIIGPQVVEACEKIIKSILTTVLGHVPYDVLITDQ